MNIVNEELWTKNTHAIILVTSNSIKKSDGMLVAGRGTALQACTHIPNFRRRATETLTNYGFGKLNGTETYGMVICQLPGAAGPGWGLFQTKLDWRDTSPINVIVASIQNLIQYSRLHDEYLFRLPMPGYGCGNIGSGQKPDELAIMSLLRKLPDNVTVCKRAL